MTTHVGKHRVVRPPLLTRIVRLIKRIARSLDDRADELQILIPLVLLVALVLVAWLFGPVS